MEMQAFPERIGLFAIVPIREGRRTSITLCDFASTGLVQEVSCS
jgi:hypothetical protein